ncbi:MAG: hypothetical protein ABW115_22480 [Candidatus Thiodiazotropha sp. 6PLUC6]
MVDGGILDHRKFIKALITLCRDRSSGTVFYNLESGVSARMVLNQGVITWVACGELRGEEAIDAIRLIDKGRMSFNPSLKLTIGKQRLPTTPEILREINTRDFNSEAIDQPQKTAASSPDNSRVTTGNSFSREDICKVVVEESIEYIGPIAKVLCADYMKSMPAQIDVRNIRKLIDSMAMDINDEVKGRVFKNRIREILKIE